MKTLMKKKVLTIALTLLLVGCATMGSSAKLAYTPEIRKMSSADDRLFRDLLNAIGGVKFADEVSFPDAKQRKITAIETIVPYDNRKPGSERWTIQHDGQDFASYLVRFNPDGRGGTTFTVQKDTASK
jgi:hypothetical protein